MTHTPGSLPRARLLTHAPPRARRPAGACAIADGTVVRCTAGENNVTIFLVEDGAKRHFPNADVYASYLRPRVGLDETGDCPEISACPDGEPMPYQGACPPCNTSTASLQ